MFNELYPIKFKPLLKEKIWGGNKLSQFRNKKSGINLKIGESWEISGLEPDISIVSNGFLKGNSLKEIIEIYMGDLVGDAIYSRFGIEFPILVKFIDASDMLSIQVHPDDEVAWKHHQANGKTEMWYIIEADSGAELINGFKKDTEKGEYLEALNAGNVEQLLNYEIVSPGDVFFIPPGRVHALGSGILLTEIQQTSDLTYRIYDFGRTDDMGNPRELHTDLALEVINFNGISNSKTAYKTILNSTSNIVENQHFRTNILEFDKPAEKDYIALDSFVILIALESKFSIDYGGDKMEELEKGESILIPAALKNITLIPSGKAKLLEVYLPEI